MNIVCFLCLRPNDLFLSFISKLKDKNYDIYVCVDDNKYILIKNGIIYFLYR